MYKKMIEFSDTVSIKAVIKDFIPIFLVTGLIGAVGPLEPLNNKGQTIVKEKPFSVADILGEIKGMVPINATILVIDDDKFVAKMWNAFFKSQLPQMSVVFADHPLEAISLLANSGKSPDLIVTDNNMPHMNGTKFIENIRRGFYN